MSTEYPLPEVVHAHPHEGAGHWHLLLNDANQFVSEFNGSDVLASNVGDGIAPPGPPLWLGLAGQSGKGQTFLLSDSGAITPYVITASSGGGHKGSPAPAPAPSPSPSPPSVWGQ